MPVFLLPAALVALAALLVPLAIHLARRSEATPTDFAALQWLRQKPRPKSRLRFDEWRLLVARLLLLALIALWLARPVLPDSADMTPVVAVLPGADAGSPAPNTRTIRLTSTCLPLPARGRSRDGDARPVEESSCQNPISLIRDLDSSLAPGVPLTILVPEILHGVDAERPRLSRPITWKITPGVMPNSVGEDDSTESQSSPATARPSAAPSSFSLRGPEAAARPLRAAIAALNTPGQPANFDTTAITAPLPTPPRILVWLTPGPLPQPVRDWITAGGTALVTSSTAAEPLPAIIPWRDATGAPLIEAQSIGKGRLYRFTHTLTPAAIPALLEPDFPHHLAALFTAPTLGPTQIFARDIAPTTGGPAWPQPARDLQPLLAMLIALIFVIERWLATRRTRAVAP